MGLCCLRQTAVTHSPHVAAHSLELSLSLPATAAASHSRPRVPRHSSDAQSGSDTEVSSDEPEIVGLIKSGKIPDKTVIEGYKISDHLPGPLAVRAASPVPHTHWATHRRHFAPRLVVRVWLRIELRGQQ